MPHPIPLGRLLTLSLATLLLVPGASRADAISYQFSGTVTGSPDGSIPAGSPFRGTLSFDPNLPQVTGLPEGAFPPGVAVYGSIDPQNPTSPDALNAQVDFGGLGSFPSTSAAGGGILVMKNSSFFPGAILNSDSFMAVVGAGPGLGPVLMVSLFDSTSTALADTSLPLTLDLSKFDSTIFAFAPDGTENTTIVGQLTSLTAQAIPEPTTLAVLTLGALAGLAWTRRRA